jgi:hypothetical protein
MNQPAPPPTGTVGTRIQLFLEKIAPLSKDLAAGGKRKAAALRKLRRLCENRGRQVAQRLCLANGQTLPLPLSRRPAGH